MGLGRTVLRASTLLVAVVAAVTAALALLSWSETAFLPYDDGGRYFDAAAGVVHTDAEPLFFGMVGCAATAVGGAAALVRWKLRRR